MGGVRGVGEDRGRVKEKVRVEEVEKEERTEGGQRWREDCDEEGGRDCQDL